MKKSSETALPGATDADSSAEIGDGNEGAEEDSSSLESRADAAKLSIEAASELINLDNNNQRDVPFKVVVPTYVPEGFEVSDISSADGRFGPMYDIRYLNATTSECFEISSASGGFGGPQEVFEQLVEIDSKALGKLNLGYTESDSVRREPLIAFENLTVPGIASTPQLYSFWSRSNEDCNVVDFQVAVQVAESLDYLSTTLE